MIDVAAPFRRAGAVVRHGARGRVRGWGERFVASVGVPFFLVACTYTYYGQLNRQQTADTFGVYYTSVALVQQRTIWLDDYVQYIEQRAGEQPAMVAAGPGGHIVNRTPSASSILALPAVAAFSAAGAEPQDWEAWMEAGMLTAALTAAATVALVFVLLTRLTSRRRAALLAGVFAWATLEWGVSGQALWQHTGATLSLAIALLAFHDRRLATAGAFVALMIAFRVSTPVIALFLLPLVGRRPRDWGRFLLGIVPFALPLLVYNTVTFGSPIHQGYGMDHLTPFLNPHPMLAAQGIPGLLISPGRGLFVYSPVLLFAIVGAVRGWGVPLYRWCAVAAAAYVVVIANGEPWTVGEVFGARKLTDILPLLAVLLVPGVAAVVGTRWIWLFGAAGAWSFFVELLAAAAAPPGLWFNAAREVPLDFTKFGTWWHPTDNELVALLGSPNLAPRLALMLAIFVGALALGQLTARTIELLRRRVAS